jgi:hypothetical protein
MRLLVALIVATVLVPGGSRADDWEWQDDHSGGWSDDRSGYDVSVDLNVSGAVTFETFSGPLSSYGDWVVVGTHGRVWRPRVAAGWRPYYYGRWEWTNEGWFWVSDEPWGWAAYHYGRWTHDPYYGWVWVPGYEWAPAWVSWRTSGDVIGWAPLAPGLSVYVDAYPFVDFWWTFVPTVRFVSVPVYTVAYAPSYARHHYHRTAPAPARAAPRPGVRPAPAPAPAWGGPAPRLVADRIGRPLTPARIVAAPAPGARARPGEIPVYRPAPSVGRGRGPDAARAPGRGGVPAYTPAPPRGGGGGRGPGVAPSPGWTGQERGGGGAPAAPAPGWSGRERGGGREQAAPAPRQPDPPRQAQPSRGEDRGGRQTARGGERHERPAPAPRH